MNYGTKLTPEIEHQVLAFLRAGAFIAEAFRAAGVPDRAWHRWTDPAHQRGPFYSFQNKIKQAQSIARIVATQQVKQDDPFKWLANGPARNTATEPGWAAMSQSAEPLSTASADPLQYPEFLRFVNNVRLVMSVYPEARKMLDDLQNPPTTHQIEDHSPPGEGWEDTAAVPPQAGDTRP